MRDSQIDYSDIPPLDKQFWARAVPNPFFKPVKQHASVRIDADVLVWLKSQGKGYQTRLNAILRRAMLEELHKAYPYGDEVMAADIERETDARE